VASYQQRRARKDVKKILKEAEEFRKQQKVQKDL